MKALALVLVAAVGGARPAGCGEADDIPCAARSGKYRAEMTRRDGSCAETQEYVFDLDAPTECTGTPKVSESNCEVVLNQNCPAGNGAVKSFAGKQTWSEDGRSGYGLITISEIDADGSRGCTSEYYVDYSKL